MQFSTGASVAADVVNPASPCKLAELTQEYRHETQVHKLTDAILCNELVTLRSNMTDYAPGQEIDHDGRVQTTPRDNLHLVRYG